MIVEKDQVKCGWLESADVGILDREIGQACRLTGNVEAEGVCLRFLYARIGIRRRICDETLSDEEHPEHGDGAGLLGARDCPSCPRTLQQHWSESRYECKAQGCNVVPNRTILNGWSIT